MTHFGFKLMSELHGPDVLVSQAVDAERLGFDFVAISDHYLPWLPEHQHSPFAWSVLGAVARETSTIHIATGLTCPIIRYHPAIVAQAAATVATMADGRFTLAVGAGERLNEHVTGAPFPDVTTRHDMLLEAIDMIRSLWSGEQVTGHGGHFDAVDARLYDLPDKPIGLVMGVSGRQSLDTARQAGVDGIMSIRPDSSLVERWGELGGDTESTWAEVPFAWAPDADAALDQAMQRFRFAVPGWKVMSELADTDQFDAACATVRREDIASLIPYGPDPGPYVDAMRSFIDAGFRRISIVPVGDVAATCRFWVDEVRPALEKAVTS